MKRVSLFLTMVVLAMVPLCAQESSHSHEEHPTFFVGGLASYWDDTSGHVRALHLEPELGYFLSRDWAVGLALGFERESAYGEEREWEQSWKVAPFVRYYYLHREPFNLYLDASLGLDFSHRMSEGAQVSSKGYEVGIRPGACVDLAEGLCLCLRMGFLGYRSSYGHGEEEGLSSSGYGLRFAPEELMIGLELEF